MEADGSRPDAPGPVVPWPEARPEVAWGTSDLFREGAPLAAFFRFLVDCPSLRWFQSPAAGYDSEPFRLHGRSRGTGVQRPRQQPAHRRVRAAGRAGRVPGCGAVASPAGRVQWRIHDWREVSGTTWLVVGLGHIGSAVAVRARALGARVIGCRRTPSPSDPVDRSVTPDRLGEVVGEADVVVLSAPANPATTGWSMPGSWPR